MSAFSFAGLVAAPLFGKWTDRLGKLFNRFILLKFSWSLHTIRLTLKRKGKIPAIVGVLFGIAGNVMYFCVRTKSGITLARFISGVGFSLDGSLIGTVRIEFKQTYNKLTICFNSHDTSW